MSKKKIALFKSVEYNYESIYDENMEDFAGHIRTSDYIEVEFISLNQVDIAAKEIAILKGVKKTIQAEAQNKLNRIDDKIKNLLALPNLKD